MKRGFSVLLVAAFLSWQPAPAARAVAEAPKLIVLVAVDQMRADYPVRYAALLSKGLERLTTGGAWFTNARYPYLTTVTCVGHNTIGTGTFPYQHGMVQNEWFDRASQKRVACTADPDVTDVVPGGPVPGVGDSAVRNLMPTLADVMRRELHSHVVAISIKARSAIGLAGHGGDAVIWISSKGEPETSTAYSAPSAMAWAGAFAKANPASGDAGKTWKRSLPPERYQYSDDGIGEKPGGGSDATFPHELGSADDRQFIGHWEQSPFANDYLEKMAESAIDELKLGQQGRTDFLGISFSSLDIVGHAFGPRSHEVQDVLVRLDAALGRLLDHLDETVGRGRYVLALTADHGVADVAEQVPGGGRVMSATVTAAVEAALKPFFGDGPFVAANLGGDLYFKPGVYDQVIATPKALAAVRSAVLGVTGVARVLTSADVSGAAARASKDAIIRAGALSYYPGRSGDLLIVTKPNVVFGSSTTTHGSPYDYDQRVPLIFYGAGIAPGKQSGDASPADAAATLASIVGVTLPSPGGRILTTALERSSSKTSAR